MKRIALLLIVLSFYSRFCFGQDPVGAKRFTSQMIHSGNVNSVAFSPDGTKAH